MPYVIQSVKKYTGKVRGWNLTQDMQCRTDVVQQHQAATECEGHGAYGCLLTDRLCHSLDGTGP